MKLHYKYRFAFFIVFTSCIDSQAHIRSFPLMKYVDENFCGMECFYFNYVDRHDDNLPSSVILSGKKEGTENGMVRLRISSKEVVFYLPVVDMHVEAWKLFNQINQRKMKNFYTKENESSNVGSTSVDINHHAVENRNLLSDVVKSTGP